MLKLCTTLTLLLLLLFNAGCTLDTSSVGSPCGDPADFVGCFARVPDVASPDDPEIYLHVNSEGECRISGYGSLGAFSHFVFTARTQATEETTMFAVTGHDIDAETTNQFRIDIEAAGGGGIVFRVAGYRFGSDAEWSSSMESWSGPFYLPPVECREDSGE
jgi:hypothetical protein